MIKLVKLVMCVCQEEMKSCLQKSNPRRKLVMTEPGILGFQVWK